MIVKLDVSANMFYLLKHLLFLNFVIFKLNYNNLNFNEIMVLNASFACLPHSRFIEDHPIWILKDRSLISEVLSHKIREYDVKRSNVQYKIENGYVSHIFFYMTLCLTL
jgi:hypothetical protein